MNRFSSVICPSILITLCVVSQSVRASSQPLDFPALAAQCAPGIHIKTLSAVVRHESNVRPYAIGLNSKDSRLPRQPRNKGEAIATAEWLKANGYNFDGGFGQVNVRNLDWLGMSVADLFDPCKNLAGAARVLTDCYSRASKQFPGEQQALQAALSCYNTGNFTKGFSNGYVSLVAANATLDVPALVPIESGTKEPVKLQAVSQQPAPIQPASQPAANPSPTAPDGLIDAFGAPQADAFAVSADRQRKAQDRQENAKD